MARRRLRWRKRADDDTTWPDCGCDDWAGGRRDRFWCSGGWDRVRVRRAAGGRANLNRVVRDWWVVRRPAWGRHRAIPRVAVATSRTPRSHVPGLLGRHGDRRSRRMVCHDRRRRHHREFPRWRLYRVCHWRDGALASDTPAFGGGGLACAAWPPGLWGSRSLLGCWVLMRSAWSSPRSRRLSWRLRFATRHGAGLYCRSPLGRLVLQ